MIPSETSEMKKRDVPVINKYLVIKFLFFLLLWSIHFTGIHILIFNTNIIDHSQNNLTLNTSDMRRFENSSVLQKFLLENEKNTYTTSDKELFVSFFGGSESDSVNQILTDLGGNIFLSGSTSSADFPVMNAFQSTFGGGTNDIFLTKFSPAGQLLFSTYLGGSGYEEGVSLALDSSGNIVVAGETDSANFPVVNTSQSTYNGSPNVFLTKFSPTGQLLFSTYLGGSGDDLFSSLAQDTFGNILVVGNTNSADFPVENAFQSTYGGGRDIFVIKFSSDGQLLFSTYLGGLGWDEISSVVLDSFDNIILAGITVSSDFPVVNASQSTWSGFPDGLLTKFSPAGQILFSTYLGGSRDDLVSSLALDPFGNILVVGRTYSADFPVVNASQSTYGEGSDIFLTKISPTGQLLFSTYLGGSGFEDDVSLVLDPFGNIVVASYTYSTDFPVVNASQSTYSGDRDIFLTKFSPVGLILFSTYLGGSGDDLFSSLVLDPFGNILVVGWTYSADFPVVNASQSTFGGEQDIFLTKFSPAGLILFSTYLGGEGSDGYLGYFNIPNSWVVPILNLDSFGNIVVVGGTFSVDFPVVNTSHNTFYGERDIFLTIFSPAGLILFSTYLGGSKDDLVSSLALDPFGNIIVAGGTNSTDFSVVNAFQNTYGGGSKDSFLTRVHFDFDGDGMNDNWESIYGLDPLINDAQDDFDNDGIPNIYEYRNGLIPNSNDAMEDKDQDGLTNILEYSLGSMANNKDTDYDGMSDGFEYQMGFNLTSNMDAGFDRDNDGLTNLQEFQFGSSVDLTDTDGDQIPDYYEYYNDLNPVLNDSGDDRDGDGMPNYWEYQMGLQANFNDSMEDKESDGMPNLWEYQMGLNATLNDASWDKDGDWVTNYNEYLSGTDANNFWSFPFLYSEFPYLINAPVMLFVGFCVLGVVTGGITGYQLKRRQQLRLMTRLGTPDYKTALQMQQGNFTDYETYQKALEQNITDINEYEFMKELNSEEKGMED